MSDYHSQAVTVAVIVEGKEQQWPAYMHIADGYEQRDPTFRPQLTPYEKDGYRVKQTVDRKWHAFKERS